MQYLDDILHTVELSGVSGVRQHYLFSGCAHKIQFIPQLDVHTIYVCRTKHVHRTHVCECLHVNSNIIRQITLNVAYHSIRGSNKKKNISSNSSLLFDINFQLKLHSFVFSLNKKKKCEASITCMCVCCPFHSMVSHFIVVQMHSNIY